MDRRNLWAPWRIGYIVGIDQNKDACFLCRDVAHPEHDARHLVLWRTSRCITVLNRFPYNNGHLLVAPLRHIADLAEASDEEMLDLMKAVRKAQQALTQAVNPHGFNIGINIGRCAGAGLPGHLHIHVIPRWNGDTNFLSTCGDAKVISQGLDDMREQLLKTAQAP